MNLSYCRFRNTLPDLRDCLKHLEDSDLSEEEHRARVRMVQLINDHAGVDEELLSYNKEEDEVSE